MMKIQYSPEADAMYIKMNTNIIAGSKRITDNIRFDLDESGELVGIELLDASQFVEDLSQVDFENPTQHTPMSDEKWQAHKEAVAKARRAKNAKNKSLEG